MGDPIPSQLDLLRDEPEKAVEEFFRFAQESYKAEFERLDEIAFFVSYRRYGDFLKAVALAWRMADPWNKRILRPAWERLVKKYDIDGDYERFRGVRGES